MGNFITAIAVVLMLGLGGCQHSDHHQAKEKIQDVLDGQVRAWNKGDVEGYMKGYWMSDSLLFTGGKAISSGWQPTLDRYLQAYPDQASMGQLSFSELDTRMSSTQSAYTVGQWKLERKNDTLSGRFTLVWKKVHGAWVIVADHSS